MVNQSIIKINSALSHHSSVVAFAIGLIIGAVVVSMWLPYQTTAPGTTDGNGVTGALASISVAEPARLRIPSVGIDTTFEGPLGVNDDQSIQVPESYDELGWYQHAPLPGELGPAVILGHVDSFAGPAVFHPLSKTKVGETIEIKRHDGTVATFVITKLLYRTQAGFPTEAVYGNIDHAGLRLITCSGTFDRGKQVYSHNLIVFAELASDTARATTQ